MMRCGWEVMDLKKIGEEGEVCEFGSGSITLTCEQIELF